MTATNLSIDPGRQPERTWLAWRRTALAMTVVTCLAIRLGLAGGTVGALVAVVWVVGWAGLIVLLRPWRSGPPRRFPSTAASARTRARSTSGSGTPRPPAAPGRALALAAAVTVGYAGLGILLVLDTLG